MPYEECGKLIVARDATEISSARGHQVAGAGQRRAWLARLVVRRSRRSTARPRCRRPSCPTTAITDCTVARAFLDEHPPRQRRVAVQRSGDRLRAPGSRDARAHARRRGNGLRSRPWCASLQSDRLAQAAGDSAEPRIVPFRGESHQPGPGRSELIRGLLVPRSGLPHSWRPASPTGSTEPVGPAVPNAVLTSLREGSRGRDISWGRSLADALNSPGLRRLVRRHWRMGWREWRGSLSRRAFAAGARSSVPELPGHDLRPAPAGVCKLPGDTMLTHS